MSINNKKDNFYNLKLSFSILFVFDLSLILFPAPFLFRISDDGITWVRFISAFCPLFVFITKELSETYRPISANAAQTNTMITNITRVFPLTYAVFLPFLPASFVLSNGNFSGSAFVIHDIGSTHSMSCIGVFQTAGTVLWFTFFFHFYFRIFKRSGLWKDDPSVFTKPAKDWSVFRIPVSCILSLVYAFSLSLTLNIWKLSKQ